jgi:LIVCS family branched-chain amino acid:cation transporter
VKISLHLKTVATGLAMFSMFFGAGNVIFPLVIGHYAQDKTFFAILGLLITAVLVPFGGLFAMLLFEGDHKRYFAVLGKFPGFLIALFIITLLGPLGSLPRCIALASSTVRMSVGDFSPVAFNALACGLIFFFTYQKRYIMEWLGYILTPLLLGSLAYIITKGLLTAEVSSFSPQQQPSLTVFLEGLKEGYNTMDLLAALFFSSIIFNSLKNTLALYPQESLVKIGLKSCALGAFLLALTYIGFSYVASFHSAKLKVESVEQLLGAITMEIIGPSAGIWVCSTIALACLTTAIALSNVFADFISHTVFQNKISYKTALIGTLLATFIVANLQFAGISAFLIPILKVCYPFLMLLTVYNIVTQIFARKTLSIAQAKD